MRDAIDKLSGIAKSCTSYSLLDGTGQETAETNHPFDQRNIHPKIAEVSKKLFDDGHFPQATFEAYKLLESIVQKDSQEKGITGQQLMLKAFDGNNPLIRLNDMSNRTKKDEQNGFRFIFAGCATGIRNPRAHGPKLHETVDECLDHLSAASLLMRKLDNARNFQDTAE